MLNDVHVYNYILFYLIQEYIHNYQKESYKEHVHFSSHKVSGPF